MNKNKIIKDIEADKKIISSMMEKSSIIIKLVYEVKKKKFIKHFT